MADDPMNRPSWFQTQLSVGNLLSIGTMIVGLAASWTSMNGRLNMMEEFRKTRTQQTDAKFTDLGNKIAELPQLSYRVTAAEMALKAINDRLDTSFRAISERLDRSAESTSKGLSEISASVGALDTRVAVLTQRLEMLPRDQRADMSERLSRSR
ncbi:hypothetical protein [Mangrovicella endophytica]|uniref:hypothetical protein n=1 Tax=Mangrovicella endophytica TaxID=2066697 RepID=UPI000C9E84BC|nr:hypothetical protein [Mangrovicella endophytica]